MIFEILRLAGFWVLVTSVAHVMHLAAGCLAVGREQVFREARDFYSEVGPARYVGFVLTGGYYKGGADAE